MITNSAWDSGGHIVKYFNFGPVVLFSSTPSTLLSALCAELSWNLRIWAGIRGRCLQDGLWALMKKHKEVAIFITTLHRRLSHIPTLLTLTQGQILCKCPLSLQLPDILLRVLFPDHQVLLLPTNQVPSSLHKSSRWSLSLRVLRLPTPILSYLPPRNHQPQLLHRSTIPSDHSLCIILRPG